jgi:hypothetical protein
MWVKPLPPSSYRHWLDEQTLLFAPRHKTGMLGNYPLEIEVAIAYYHCWLIYIVQSMDWELLIGIMLRLFYMPGWNVLTFNRSSLTLGLLGQLRMSA